MKEQVIAKVMSIYGVQGEEVMPSVAAVVKVARTNLRPENFDRLSGVCAEVLADVVDSIREPEDDTPELPAPSAPVEVVDTE